MEDQQEVIRKYELWQRSNMKVDRQENERHTVLIGSAFIS
jgi:hypothetical protein